MKLKIFYCIIFLLWSSTSWGQEIKQTVKGKITDKNQNVLVGATIKISNTKFNQGTNTNDAGYFEITGVPTGRYHVHISFSGYSPIDEELLVISAREATVNVQLQEYSIVLNEVEVTGTEAVNDEIPGLKSLTIEKTMRVPANFFDPVRMVTTYPGIIAANDQGNSIIIKGNSPNGLLWRLNGLDIVNPNHLANAGTLSDKPISNGGGINILSAQMLGRTNFYTGAFPANYGNALSGVIDMSLRNGNNEKTEITAQASLIGLDVSAEGPINKKKNINFLANYRYSTVGLLSKLGIDFGGEVIDFQDFSFNLNKVNTKGNSLSLFGFGGLSKNEFKEKEQAEWEEDKDHTNINYTAKTFALGMNYNVPLKRGSFSVAVGYSGTDQTRNMLASLFVTTPSLFGQHYDYNRSVLSNNIAYETKLSERVSWEIGSVTDYIDDALQSYDKESQVVLTNYVEGKSNGVLLQPYTKFDVSISPSLTMTAGVRYVNFTYNKSQAIEPRFLLRYQPNAKQFFNLSYSLVSQVQLPVLYYTPGNSDVGFTKSHHATASYHRVLNASLKFNTEIYYQHLFDVPVEQVASTFSAINLMEGYSPGNLVNKGTGNNYGLNATLEKSFYNATYFMLGGSYYESTYKGSDGTERDSRFNGKYTVNAAYGKEWTSQKKNRTIGLNLRMLYLGGLRETPIDVAASQANYETVYDNTRAFENKLKNYFRPDLRLTFRRNKPTYTRTFSIDIQNLTGQQNEAYHYYDYTKNKVVTKYQLGLIPVLVYRIDF